MNVTSHRHHHANNLAASASNDGVDAALAAGLTSD
jgi:hypothetical protein